MEDEHSSTPETPDSTPAGAPSGVPSSPGTPAPAEVTADHRPAPAGPRPRVTPVLIGLIGAVFLLQYIPALGLLERFGFMPALAAEQPWRMLTHAFVHSQPSPLHVGFNLLALFFFGSFLERALGHVRFAVVYVLGALGGAVCVLVLADPTNPASWFALHVGASGAVFALVGALLTPTRELDRNLGGVIVLVALNAAIPLLEPNISWESHLGGLITGFALGCAALLPPSGRRPLVFGAAALLMVAVLGGLTVLKLLAVAGLSPALSTF
ncbi:membrane associated rhomboid family serine protease [Brevibacterium pityocampae]